MLAQHAFGNLKQAVETAGSLEGRGTANHGQNRQNDVDRGLTDLDAEAEDKDEQADAADKAEAIPPLRAP